MKALAVILLSVALVMATAARGATPTSGTITATNPSVSWTGATFAAAANAAGSYDGCFDASGRPLAVAVTSGPIACEAFTLDVALDAAFWADKSGGVTIKVGGYGPADDFDLYLFRRNADGTRGALVDDSANAPGTPETLYVDTPTGGFYVVAVGFLVAASDYDAVAGLELNPQFKRTGRPFASYLHDVTPKDPNITVQNSIVEQHRIPAPDGVMLDTWIVRPRVDGPVPVVLRPTPYHGGGSPITGTGHLLGFIGNELVPRGFAVGIYSIRGTGNSEGCFQQGGPGEALDTAAVVEYYGAQEWSNGSVGLIGASYDGTAPQDVWVEAPPSLKTIVPVSGISDMYKYNFVNGVHINSQGYAFNAYYWGLVGLTTVYAGGTNQFRDPVYIPGSVIGEVCPEQVWVQEGGASSAVDGNKDGYWQARDFLAELNASSDKQRASVFYIHGLQDWNVKPHNMEDWLEAVQATGVPFKAWLGQWDHAFPYRDDWYVVLAAWFEQTLKGRNTGVLDGPRVQIETDQHVWRHEQAFPPKHTKAMTLRPTSGGTLSATGSSGTSRYYDYNGRLATAEEMLLKGQPDRVLWVSEPLTKDVVISGMPRFEGVVTASGNRANLILSLAERTPLGDRSFNFAALSLNHVESLASGRLSVAGLRQNVAVDFFPQDDVVRAGNRIVLIAAGNVVSNGEPSPGLLPAADGSTITIELNGAKLTLPVDQTVTYEK